MKLGWQWPDWADPEFARGMRDAWNMAADQLRQRKNAGRNLWLGGIAFLVLAVWNPQKVEGLWMAIAAASGAAMLFVGLTLYLTAKADIRQLEAAANRAEEKMGQAWGTGDQNELPLP
jgi:hypothetical protein